MTVAEQALEKVMNRLRSEVEGAKAISKTGLRQTDMVGELMKRLASDIELLLLAYEESQKKLELAELEMKAETGQ